MNLLRRKYTPAFLALLIVLLSCYLLRAPILWRMGAMLDGSVQPQTADMILVLGGDWSGSRILKAGELVRQGIAPKAFVSGAAIYFGRTESQLAIDFAVSRGYPRDSFIPFQAPNLSTDDEARTEGVILRSMGVKRLLLVTHAWHTARALKTFRHRMPELDIQAAGVWDKYWNHGYWWLTREGRKTWFFEATKNVANVFEHTLD